VVEDRSGGQVRFGHPEALLDLQRLGVGADHLLGLPDSYQISAHLMARGWS
jgi:hypothetical protein